MSSFSSPTTVLRDPSKYDLLPAQLFPPWLLFKFALCFEYFSSKAAAVLSLQWNLCSLFSALIATATKCPGMCLFFFPGICNSFNLESPESFLSVRSSFAHWAWRQVTVWPKAATTLADFIWLWGSTFISLFRYHVSGKDGLPVVVFGDVSWESGTHQALGSTGTDSIPSSVSYHSRFFLS